MESTKKDLLALFFLKDIKLFERVDISHRKDREEVLVMVKELVNQGFPLLINGYKIQKTINNNSNIEKLYERYRIEKGSPYR